MPEILEISMELIDEPETDIRENIDAASIEEMATSIENIGLIQPIAVFKKQDRYEVIVGHRRLLACRALGLGRITAVVREVEPDEIDIMRLDENVFREDVSAIQIASYIYRIQKAKGMSTMEISRYLGKTPQWVNSMLRLIDIDDYTKQAVDQGEMSYSAALELQKIEDLNYRRVLTEAAVKGGAHTRVIKSWVNQYQQNKAPGPEPLEEDYQEPTEEIEKVYRMKCKLCGVMYDPGELITIQIDPHCFPIFEEMAKNVRGQLEKEETTKE